MIIEVDKLKKSFGRFIAVDEISFEVQEGIIFGILGANGAGKTTTIRMLCGLLIPTSGRLEVAGMDVVKNPREVRKCIGYMSQQFSLYPDLTVLENLQFYGGVYGIRAGELSVKIENVLSELELTSYKYMLAASLSLGYKQRLALASASLHIPKILFLDEPTSGVDPLSRLKFWSYVRKLVYEFSTTVIVTTHFLNEAEYCDHIILMHEGKIATKGTPQQVKNKVAEEISIYEIATDSDTKYINELIRFNYVKDIYSWGKKYRITVKKDKLRGSKAIVDDFSKYINLLMLKEIKPTLEDAFIRYYRM